MRVIIAVLLLLTLAFAGCASKGGGDGDGSTSESSTATGSGSGIQSSTGSKSTSQTGTSSSSATGTGSAANRAPNGGIQAKVNGTAVQFNLTGTDLDGDALSWTLAFGDASAGASGTMLPSLVNHTYAVGAYVATFNLTDGKGTASYNVTLNMTAAAGAVGLQQVVAGSWAVGVTDSGAVSELFLCAAGPLNEVTHYTFLVDPATRGKPFTATLSDASDGASVQDWAIIFNEEGCLAFDQAPATGAAPIAGTVPAKAYLAWVVATGGAQLEVAYTAG